MNINNSQVSKIVIMKKIVVVISIVLAFVACEKSTNEINLSTTTDSVNIPVGNCTEKLYEQNIGINYCFDSLLQDSRCPYNAFCIWGGFAKARFKITVNNQLHTVELYSPNPNFNSDTVIGGIRFAFENITPENGFPNSTYNDYRAILKVRKL